jgi:DNA-binding response OmpR family regulator
MNDEKKVLVVEDEGSIRKFITINLNNNGFQAFEADSGEMALTSFDKLNPDIVILDIMLPGIDGYEVCQQIRQKRNDVIIIMLTAKTQDMDKILGLELGADDYMVKPFNPLELVARIRAILRRTGKIKENNKEIIIYRNLKLDLRSQKFFKNDREIVLTPIEFSLVKTFIENSGAALSRDELLNTVWGENYFGDVKTVDVHIRRLREKIEDNPSEPQFIETVWGYGYRWQREI